MTTPQLPDGPLPVYVTVEPPAPKRSARRPVRSADRTLAIMMAWLVVVAGGAIGIATLAGGRGADGPAGAVDALLAAASEEDVLGVLEAMAPVERDILVDGVTDLTAELERLGVLEGVDLRGVGGIDLEFEDVTYQEVSLTESIVAVEVTGGVLTATATCEGLPLGAAMDEISEGDWEEECDGATETATEDLGDSGIRLVAVEDGGRWFVSAGYSVAEAVRHDSGAPVPAFDGAIGAIGAESPEAAVEGLAARSADMDLEGMIGMLAPDEMAPLYDYAPLFLDDLQDELDETGTALSIDVDVSEVSRDGSVARVGLDAYSMSATFDDGSVDIVYDGECVTTTETGTDDGWTMVVPNSGAVFSPEEPLTEDELDGFVETDGDGVVSDDELEEWAELIGGDDVAEDTVETCLDELGGEEAGSGSFWPLTDVGTAGSVTVVEVGGRWYVSPMRSAFDALVTLLASVDDLDGWFDAFFGVTTEERFEAVGEAIPSEDLEGFDDYDYEDYDYEDYDYEAIDEAYFAVEECGLRFDDLLYSEEATARELYEEALAAAACGEATLATFPADVVAEVGPVDAGWFDYCFDLYAGISDAAPPELRAAADQAVTRCLEESWGIDLPDAAASTPSASAGEPSTEDPPVAPSTPTSAPEAPAPPESTTIPPAGG